MLTVSFDNMDNQYLTHRLVFDGGTGDTQVQFAVLLNAGIDQSLNRALVLKQQECISWKVSTYGRMSLHILKLLQIQHTG